MKVLFLPEVRSYLNDLINLLFDLDYFSSVESSSKYINELFNDIQNNLYIKVKRKAPLHFRFLGAKVYYTSFTKSRHTQWYVFFSVYLIDGEEVYLVRYIANNHIIARYL